MSEKLLHRRIVTIGGGTGGFILNRGFHAYSVDQTAICTAFDSGGSSGALRDEFGTLPPGDVRRCIVAMAGDSDDTLRELMNYRFPEGNNGLSALAGHNLGNLLLSAAEKEWGHIDGIRRLSKVLGVQGRILPVSIDNANLCAELSDGSHIVGEANIDTRSVKDERSINKVWLKPSAVVHREVVDAILKAQIIVLGPGDLYTSIIPNLLVRGVAEAIQESKAIVVYVCNLMTKWSETRDFDAADFVEETLKYRIGREKFDVVLVNTAQIPARLLPSYEAEDRSKPVVFDDEVMKRLSRMTEKVVTGDFLSRASLNIGLIRHGPHRLAKQIVELEVSDEPHP